MSSPLLVPLGRYVGLLPVTDGSKTALEFIARLGGRRVILSDDEMRVWALAHGTAGAPGLDHWDRAAVRRVAPPDARNVDATIDRLIAVGLLVEVGDPVEFARGVRLLPMAPGLGNSPDRLRAFTIGRAENPLVVVPTVTYLLWSWACLQPNLWAACEQAHALSAPYGEPGTARDFLSELLNGLHALLATDAACLDTAVPA